MFFEIDVRVTSLSMNVAHLLTQQDSWAFIFGCLLKFNLSKRSKKQCDRKTPSLYLRDMDLIQPIADNMALYLEIISNFFQVVPSVPGFPWDSSLLPCYYAVLIVNPINRILVR